MGDISRMKCLERIEKACKTELDEMAENNFIITVSGGLPEMYDGPADRKGSGVVAIDVDYIEHEEPEDATKDWYLEQIQSL